MRGEHRLPAVLRAQEAGPPLQGAVGQNLWAGEAKLGLVWGLDIPKVYKPEGFTVGISSLRIMSRTDCTQRGVRRGPSPIVCRQSKRGGTIEWVHQLPFVGTTFDSVISMLHFLSPQSLRLVHPPLFLESYRSEYRLDVSSGLPIPIPPLSPLPIPQFIKHAPCHHRAPPPPRSGCGRSSRRIARTTTSHGWSTCPPPSARAPRGPVRQEFL